MLSVIKCVISGFVCECLRCDNWSETWETNAKSNKRNEVTQATNAHLCWLCRWPFLVGEQWQQGQLIFFLGLLQKWSKPPSAAIFTAWHGWRELRPRRALPTALRLTDNTFHRFQIQKHSTAAQPLGTNSWNSPKLRQSARNRNETEQDKSAFNFLRPAVCAWFFSFASLPSRTQSTVVVSVTLKINKVHHPSALPHPLLIQQHHDYHYYTPRRGLGAASAFVFRWLHRSDRVRTSLTLSVRLSLAGLSGELCFATSQLSGAAVAGLSTARHEYYY